MKKRLILGALLIAGFTQVNAQNKFYLNGLGRGIVTSNQLGGNLLSGDNTTVRKGVRGYTLFDLGMNVEVDSSLQANSILRVKSAFGGFFGTDTDFEFRQFQLNGKVKGFNYGIGDINVEMSPYTVHNPDVMFTDYEADVIAARREILEYENFNFGNAWRLQGVHFNKMFNFNSDNFKGVNWYAFGTRTDVTNDLTIPDRVLLGTNVNIIKDENLQLGGNYVGMQDIFIESSAIDYVNHVVTGNGEWSTSNDSWKLSVGGEGGISDYTYTEVSSGLDTAYNDFFFDLGATFELKSTGIKISASYRDVGPQFSSPSAQTRRININTTPDLFGDLAGLSATRSQVLYDRISEESIYNRNINPVLYQFLPQYGNITPYGQATPNRKGITVNVATTDSMKYIKANVQVQLLNEIIGEGVVETRSFTGIQGGFVVDAGAALGLDRLFTVNVGARSESTTRGGGVPVDFSSMAIDAGVTFEVYDNIDILGGMKMLSASGTEYLQVRDNFNILTSFPLHDIDISENIIALGARFRFGENSNFSATYNIGNVKDNKDSTTDYDISQLFLNYTLIF